MLLANFNYESIKNKLKDIYKIKGKDGVKSWCIDFGMDLKTCKHCDDKTPILHTITTYECAVCSNKVSIDR